MARYPLFDLPKSPAELNSTLVYASLFQVSIALPEFLNKKVEVVRAFQLSHTFIVRLVWSKDDNLNIL